LDPDGNGITDIGRNDQLGEAVVGAGAATAGQYVFIVGGETDVGTGETTDTISRYDIASDSFFTYDPAVKKLSEAKAIHEIISSNL
jgi:hypothetical protein